MEEREKEKRGGRERGERRKGRGRGEKRGRVERVYWRDERERKEYKTNDSFLRCSFPACYFCLAWTNQNRKV